MYTYAGLTAPLPATDLARLGSDPNWGLLPAHRLGATLRRTVDGRLMVRSFYGYEREEDNARVAGRLRDCLTRRFPQLELDAEQAAILVLVLEEPRDVPLRVHVEHVLLPAREAMQHRADS